MSVIYARLGWLLGLGRQRMNCRKRIWVFVTQVTAPGLVVAFLVGCGSQRGILEKEVLAGAGFTNVQEPPEYRIRPGDQMEIKFFFNPELNETVFVRPDGKISLQLIDEVRAAGLTVSELDETLTQMYAQELRKPVIAVIMKSFTGQQVYVGGEVEKAGLINLTAGMTAFQAVIQAQGFKETAKPEGVIVIRKGPDSRPIPIRVDLGQVIDGEPEAKDLILLASDIVYVPKTWIAEADKFVNQYIQRLLLYQGFSFGYGFNFP